jgi:hydroxymethylpyrimidine pyrophosphatase-like HAD family hydrolase
MMFDALATDYDGTLAHHGIVDDTTIAALRRAREGGVRLLMVTGRELGSLFDTFAHAALFDLIVAENGAVLYEPATEEVQVLSPPPPPNLLARLAEARVPISVGHAIVATVEPHHHEVLQAIHDLGLEWHVIFNKGAVMALPADVTKASGLSAALRALGLRCSRTIGVGDAENDQAFFRACGLAVAVANALPSVKDAAHLVTANPRGAGVVELIDRLLAGQLAERHNDPHASQTFKFVPNHPVGACKEPN